jgi:acylphosphatase
MKHLSIHITGKVQGVFFRASAKQKAEELHVKGTARNNADGTVSLEAEGEEEALTRFIEWCRKGPPLSRVDRCDIEEKDVQHFSDFTIDRRPMFRI